MKNGKNTRRILFLVVITIWGLVIYRIYSDMKGEEEPGKIARMPELEFAGDSVLVRDTFAIGWDYRDPFLGKTYGGRKPRKKQEQGVVPVIVSRPTGPPAKASTAPEIERKTDWSFLEYKGMMRITGDTALTGLLRIRSRIYNVFPGETYKKVRILGVYEDSVRVKFNQELQTIVRK